MFKRTNVQSNTVISHYEHMFPPLQVYYVYVFTGHTEQPIPRHEPGRLSQEFENCSSLMTALRTRKANCPVHGQMLGPTDLTTRTQESWWHPNPRHPHLVVRFVFSRYAKPIHARILYHWIFELHCFGLSAVQVADKHFPALRRLNHRNSLHRDQVAVPYVHMQLLVLRPGRKHMRMD